MTLKEFREASDLLINHPSHYNQGKIECIDAMVSAYGKEAVMDFCLCNAMKYIWRMPYKNKGNTSEDLHKAIWYLNKYLDLETEG